MSVALSMFSELKDGSIFRFPGTSHLYVRYAIWSYIEPGDTSEEPFIYIPKNWNCGKEEYEIVDFMVEQVSE